MNNDVEALRSRFAEHGQAHVLADIDDLSDAERASLLADCGRVDFNWLEERYAQYKKEKEHENEPLALEPAPVIRLPQTEQEKQREEAARAVGEEALRAGRVAAFLVAGGQGTRLGFDGPKGCFPIGPVSGKTLFQWHAEQIRARSKRYGATIPWYIMTSRANHDATVAYFEENDYLGFDKNDVMFFQQAVVPSVTFDGKLMRATRDTLAMNPDGHGGSLSALVRSGAIADMKKRGIDTISYFQVDNPLVTICDPVFIGYHLQAEAEMSSKVLEKAYPEEKVGHVCYNNGTLCVIEYSDIDEENMHARTEDGRLKFWAGSIAIHVLDVDFVDRVGGESRLPWHIAKKKIPHLEDGTVVNPEDPNGVKFEQFVFDALPLAKSSITMEVAREEEFAPVKNASGVDSAESCRKLLSNRFGRWFEYLGKDVPRDENGDVSARIEVGPMAALEIFELQDGIENFEISGDVLLS